MADALFSICSGRFYVVYCYHRDEEGGIVEIRRYRSSDAEEVVRLFRDTVHTVNVADHTAEQLDAWAPSSVDLGEWDRSLSAHFSVVATENGELLGFGDIDESGYLDRLYVASAHIGTGVGTVICDALEAAVKGKIVTHASVTARPFFEKRGYTVVRAQQVERVGVLLTNFVMEKVR